MVTVLAFVTLTAMAALPVPVRADTKTWTGAVDNLWSTAGNWTGGLPAAGDRVVFGVSGLNRTTTNDLPAGTAFFDITFLGDNYVINGNALGLTDGVTCNQGPNTINVNLQVLGPQTMSGTYGALYLNGAIALGANTLTLGYNVNVAGMISGSGGITIGDVVTLTGNNTYTGSTLIQQRGEIDGVQPSSDVTTGAYYNSIVTGNGTVGAVTLNYAASLQPGTALGGNIGTLTTGGLTANANSYLAVALNGTVPGVGHDQVKVNGTVSIDPSAALNTSLGFTPSLGQTFQIVDNDGVDPISGTFNGLPEGGVINLNANELTITYVGGDGNDIVLTVTAAAKTWTGAVNHKWSVAGNWLGGVPGPGDPLVFPAGAANLSNLNDLPAGTAYKLILFTGANYVLSGNTIGLTNGITSNQAPNTIQAGLKILAPQTIGGSYSALTVTGDIDLGSNALTLGYNVTASGIISGTGGLTTGDVITLTGYNIYTGPTLIQQRAEINGSQPASAVSTGAYFGSIVSGVGKVGDLVLNYAASVQPGPGFGSGIGRFTTGNLSLGANSYLGLTLSGTVAGTGYDQVAVSGSIGIDPAASLSLNLTFTPMLGQTFMLVDNDNADPVTGTFTGLPENSVINLNANQFKISYVGGDGNDIVLTVVSAAKTWTGAVSALWSNPGNWQGGVPGPGDPLVFPAGASNLTNLNDLPDGTLYKLILFSGSNYVIGGNPFGLTDGISCSQSPNAINADLQIAAPQTMSGGYGPLTLNGAVSLGSNTLTLSYYVNATGPISGSGGLTIGDVVTLSGNNTYTGPTLILQRGEIDGQQPSSAVSTGAYYGSVVCGTGRTGSVTLNYAASLQPGGSLGGGIGKLSTGSLTLNANTYLYTTLNGAVPGTGYDQVSVTGGVTIDPAATLSATLGFTPAKGQIFVLVQNDGADPVAGTFYGLPQDAMFNLGPYPFQISYIGKTGNDITITSLSGDPYNFAPIAVDDAYVTQQDLGLASMGPGLLANDSDPDLQPISVVLADTVTTAGGAVGVGGDGSFVYSPPSGFTGTDTFNYIISDGTDATDMATVTITVQPDPAGVDSEAAAIPKEFAFLAPRPNPSQGAVELSVALPEAAGIRADVFDATGRAVARLDADQVFAPGIQRLSWDGRSESGAPAASGVYFVRVSSGPHTAVRKLIRVSPR